MGWVKERKVLDLGDDGELGSEVVQADLSDLYSVDANYPFCCLQQTEQTQCHGRLASSGPTHNTNLNTNTHFSWIKKIGKLLFLFLQVIHHYARHNAERTEVQKAILHNILLH